MRILLYNWIPYDNSRGIGGGVTVYLKNLMERLQGMYPLVHVSFLSSGRHYDILDRSIRYEKTHNIYEKKSSSYVIVNSPVFSPAYLSFYELDSAIENDETCRVFEKFLETEGPFDVVHFHNMEGLPLNIINCKEKFPRTKFLYSLHNYYLFCPQVNLWKDEMENCKEPFTGENCLKCLRAHVPREKLCRKMALTNILEENGKKIRGLDVEIARRGNELDRMYRNAETAILSDEENARLVHALKLYRNRAVELLNRYADGILAVSNRVKEIAVEMGIESKKIRVSYIGTKAADQQKPFHKHKAGTPVSIIYMGYQRRDKGFFFLVDVLEKLDREIARNISLTLAAGKGSIAWHLDTRKFHDYVFYNGYTSKDIAKILKNQDLGIVPPLWEDNLPQVAIEMVANGIPILTSDCGGARELGNNEKFCFHAGDVNGCVKRISHFVKHPKELEDFEEHFTGLKTFDKHLEELFEIYKYLSSPHDGEI